MTAQAPEIVVLGNSLPETLRRGHRGSCQLGGVGAIMAQELTVQGEDPLFLTPVGNGGSAVDFHGFATADTAAVELTSLLNDSGLRYQTFPTRQKPAWSDFDLSPRGRVRGEWPTYTWLDIKAAATSVLEASRQHGSRWLLLDCSFTTEALGQLLHLAQTYRWKVIINGTTKYRCKRLGGNALDGRPLHAVTLNREEMAVLSQMCGARPNAPHTVRKMFGNAQYLLNTRDKEGWTLYQAPDSETNQPAAPLPPHAHCLGAGDAATAGLAKALIRDTDPAQAINKAIRDRLRYNAATFAD